MGGNSVSDAYEPSGVDIFSALNNATKEAWNCLNSSGNYRILCAMAAFEKYFFRKIPIFKNLIYPWVNFDWSYDAYIYKFYNPMNGIKIRGEIKKSSGKGTMTTLINDFDIMFKLMGALITDPNPSKHSRASDPSALESDLHECRDFDILEQIKEHKKKIDKAKKILEIKKAKLERICEIAKNKYNISMNEIFQIPIDVGEAIVWAAEVVGTSIAAALRVDELHLVDHKIKTKEHELAVRRTDRYNKVIDSRKEKLEKVKKEILAEVGQAHVTLCNLQTRVAQLLSSLYDKSCVKLNKIKSSQRFQKAPYDDPFFKQELTGKYSSSYFANVGVCFAKNQDETHCKKTRMIWAPNPLYNETTKQMFGEPKGFCFQPRYGYVDNSPGIKGGNFKMLDGLNPSLANNIVMMSPEKTLSLAMGYSVPGFRLQPCEQIAAPKFTTIRDLAEYIQDDLVEKDPQRLSREYIDAIYREVVKLSKGANKDNGLVEMKDKPINQLEPDEITDVVSNLKKLIKISPDNSKFNKKMLNSSSDKFTIKKKSAAAISLYVFHNSDAYRVEWIDEPEGPVTSPLKLIQCDEWEGGICKLSNGLRFKNPYLQDTWSPFLTIKIGNLSIPNLKAKKPEDPEKFTTINKKQNIYHSIIILIALISILYIVTLK